MRRVREKVLGREERNGRKGKRKWEAGEKL